MSAKGNWVPVSSVLQTVLERAGLSHLLYEAKLRDNWEDLMGKAARETASLESLKGHRLKVRVSHPAWRQELHYQKEEIRRRANAILGFELVREVVLV